MVFIYDFLHVGCAQGVFLSADLNYVLRPERFVARAALGVEELQDFLKRVRVGGVSKEGAFAADLD